MEIGEACGNTNIQTETDLNLWLSGKLGVVHRGGSRLADVV
jgi:hypothetical protein